MRASRTGLAHLLYEKPWHAFATAVVIGLVAIAAWPLSTAAGRPAGLGITTPSANTLSFLVTGDVELVDRGGYLVLGILVGAALAGGCTIGNAMVNTAQFSYQGWLSFGFMVLGTGAATHVFILRHPPDGAAHPHPVPRGRPPRRSRAGRPRRAVR